MRLNKKEEELIKDPEINLYQSRRYLVLFGHHLPHLQFRIENGWLIMLNSLIDVQGNKNNKLSFEG